MSHLKSQDQCADKMSMGKSVFIKTLLGLMLTCPLGSFASEVATGQTCGLMELKYPKAPIAEVDLSSIEAPPGDYSDAQAAEILGYKIELEAQKKSINSKIEEVHTRYLTDMKAAKKFICQAEIQIKAEQATNVEGKKGFSKLGGKMKNAKQSITGHLKTAKDASINSARILNVGLDEKFAKDPMLRGSEREGAEQYAYEICRVNIFDKGVLAEYSEEGTLLAKQCHAAFEGMESSYKAGRDTAVQYAVEMGATRRRLLAVGIGAVGVGATYKILNDRSEKKKKKKREKERAEQERDRFERGIIIMADGSQRECFSTAHYQSEECRGTMQRLCQDSEHMNKSGCQAFNGFYCGSGSGNENAAYCHYSAAAAYCSGPGEALKKSPSCVWRSARPESCIESPNGLNCLITMSPTELSMVCKDFPHDPMCKKAAEGIIVTQPATGTPVAPSEEAAEASSATLSSVAGSSQDVSSSTNLWENNSSTLQNMYTTGQLENSP